jgi:ABC-type Zn uptake system ZnuABC Zn-binding protein ZnuA
MTEALSDMPLLSPFIEFGFMRRALAGCLALSLGATPIGVFLMLRRMSLAGDAMSHAILPGAAVGYLLAGLSLPAMTIGGLIAGLAVAVMAGGVARNTVIREDTSLATFYLLSLSAGVLIISLRGSSVDLLHVLFGSVLALDDATLLLLAGFTSLSVVALAIGLRLFVLESCDPAFLARISRLAPLAHYGFLISPGHQSGRRLPRARNADGGRHHDSAGSGRPPLGVQYRPAVAARRYCAPRVDQRPASFLLHQRASRTGHRPDSRRPVPAVDWPSGHSPRSPAAGGRLAFRALNALGIAHVIHPPACLHRLTAIALLALGMLVSTDRTAAADVLPVVVSFSILGDLTRQIGGERVEVHTLVGPGADAHVYQPTPADAKKLARARLVIVNGLGFEGWIDRLIKSSGYRGKLVVASQGINAIRHRAQTSTSMDHVSTPIPTISTRTPGRIWPTAAATWTRSAAALVDVDPPNRSLSGQRRPPEPGDRRARQQIRSTLGALPADDARWSTSHDAFRVLRPRLRFPLHRSGRHQHRCRTFGRRHRAIIRQIRKEKIRAMFIENIADPRLLERISRESGARVGGTLYSDSLATAGSPADTYLGMMRQNAKTLAAALAD